MDEHLRVHLGAHQTSTLLCSPTAITAVSPNVTRRWRASTEFGEEKLSQTPWINSLIKVCVISRLAAGSARQKLNPEIREGRWVGQRNYNSWTPAEQATALCDLIVPPGARGCPSPQCLRPAAPGCAEGRNHGRSGAGGMRALQSLSPVSLRPQGLEPARLLRPRASLIKNPRAGRHRLGGHSSSRSTFPTQELEQVSRPLPLSHREPHRAGQMSVSQLFVVWMTTPEALR